MPQLPVSLSATLIGKLDEIAKAEEKKERIYDERVKIRASTIAARIIRAYFEEAE